MRIENGRNAYILLSGTKDGYYQDAENGEDRYYTLKEFNLYFSKNDINVLKDIFLYKKVKVDTSSFYEYNRNAENISNRYGYYPSFLCKQKNMDEILTAVTNVYTRLYNELDISERVNVIDKFIKFLTMLNLVNATLAQRKSTEYLTIVRYIDMFTSNNVLSQAIYNQVYFKMDKYNKNSENFIKPNVDGSYFKTEDYELVKKYDREYIYLRDNNKLKPYINNDELDSEEQREKFCNKYHKAENEM